MHSSGLLLVATTPDGLASYVSIFRELRALGFTGEISEVQAPDACRLEPSLSPARIAGGVHALVDRYVRPETLTAGLAAWLEERGVEFLEHTPVDKLEAGRDGVLLATSSGRIDADRTIVCAGASSPALLRNLGVRMPLVGARGYSVTVAGGETRPMHALYLAEAKVGISSYDDSVRIAGVFELGSASEELDHKKLRAMVSRVDPYFEHWRPSADEPLLEWAGLRPMTADGLPLVGPAPSLPNVYVATGHGMLGVTLAPATAALLAPLVLEGRIAPELTPFAPARTA
jgi:D-amino-acid dehydrogenase